MSSLPSKKLRDTIEDGGTWAYDLEGQGIQEDLTENMSLDKP